MKKLALILMTLMITQFTWSQYLSVPTANQTDSRPITVGMRFVPKASGIVKGIRFYRFSTWPSSVTVQLWSGTGTQLKTATSTTTGTAWSVVNFTTPQQVTQGVEYVATYSNQAGYYSVQYNYFPKSFQLYDAVGSRYVYVLNTYPTADYQNSNYFVEPIFETTTVTPPPTTNPCPTTPPEYIYIRDTVKVYMTDTSGYSYWRKYSDSLSYMLSIRPPKDTITVDRSASYTDSAMRVWPFQGIWNYEFTIGAQKYRFIRSFVWKREELVNGEWKPWD